jgi:uncharacterized protein YuzE
VINTRNPTNPGIRPKPVNVSPETFTGFGSSRRVQGFSLAIMKLHVDHEADALYLRLDDSKIIESEDAAPGVVLDYDERNQVVGIKMLNLSSRTP